MVKLKARYSTGSCSFISLDGRLRIAMEYGVGGAVCIGRKGKDRSKQEGKKRLCVVRESFMSSESFLLTDDV